MADNNLNNQVIEMTEEGYNKLKDEYENRRIVVRHEAAERIKLALSFGDLSENSEYSDAREFQAQNDERISYLEKILKNAKVISSSEISVNKVSLGSQVSLLDEQSGETQVYTLVNSKEEDIFENKISTESPVGKALLGKKKGNVVEVKTPIGQLKYKIVKIGK